MDVPQRGISRHPVRFVASDGRTYALKEIAEPLARHEYALLGELEAEGLPAVSVPGSCVDRPDGLPAVLVTRFLEPAEVFHEVLEHRWYLSEEAGVDVGTTAAARSNFAAVLPRTPEELGASVAALL